MSFNHAALARVVAECSDRWTEASADIQTYLAAAVSDSSHREIIGPLRAGTGASGVVWVHGEEVAMWGNADAPEMAFSVTKSVVSVIAGLAFDVDLLHRVRLDLQNLRRSIGRGLSFFRFFVPV